LGIPPAIESAVMKALAKDRNQRYASAFDFARAFMAAAQPSPRAEALVPISRTPTRPPAVTKPPQFRMAPEPHSKMKFVVIAVVALILIVAGVWHFLPPANPPIVKPQSESAAPPTGVRQQVPVVETPAPTAHRPIESETNAPDRQKQVKAAKRIGDNYYESGEYDNAINTYQEGLKMDPSNAQLLQAVRRAQTAKAAEAEFDQ
jgi:tetratricopeptide (TPR) repeat protein